MVELPFYLSPVHWFVWLFLLYLLHSHFSVSYTLGFSTAVRRSLPVFVLLSVLILGGFFIHTLRSLSDLAKFIEGGSQRLDKLELISNNPALMEYGMRVTMITLFRQALHRKSIPDIRRFIEWAEGAIVYNPEPNLLAELALGYAHLGDMKNAVRVIDRATAIYNKNASLHNYQKMIYA